MPEAVGILTAFFVLYDGLERGMSLIGGLEEVWNRISG